MRQEVRSLMDEKTGSECWPFTLNLCTALLGGPLRPPPCRPPAAQVVLGEAGWVRVLPPACAGSPLRGPAPQPRLPALPAAVSAAPRARGRDPVSGGLCTTAPGEAAFSCVSFPVMGPLLADRPVSPGDHEAHTVTWCCPRT